MENKISYFKLYLCIFTITSIFIQIIGYSQLYFGLFLILLLLYISNKIKVLPYLICSMIIPNKLIQFLSIFIYIILNYKLLNKIYNKYIFYFINFVIISSLINLLFFEGSIINLILQLCIYLIYLLAINILSTNQVDNKYFFKVIKDIFYLQIIIATLQLFIYKEIGDCIKGTFLSAHYYGVFLILFLYKYILIKYKKLATILKNKKDLMLISVIIFNLIIADAKHVYFVFIIAILIFIFIDTFKGKNIIVTSGIFLLVAVILGIQVFKLNDMRTYMISEYTDNAQYIYRDNYNQKYRYFDRTINSLYPFRGIIGFGIGQYGSQFANFRAYETIYKVGGVGARKDIIRPYISDIYRENIGDLMNEEYVTNISNISMVMSFPIVSFIPFIAELGIIGYILFLYILQNIIKKKEDSIFIIFFLLLTIFDIYFEIPSVFIMIILFAFYTEPINFDFLRRVR